MLWDIRTMSLDGEQGPLHEIDLDQGTGALFPTYDPDTKMLLIAGKGDANCRYFESVEQDPYLHFISQYGDKNPQRGFDFLPKLAVDTRRHEIMRAVKCEANSVVPISFLVPRKSDAFQEDIYPDTYTAEPTLSADEWLAGKDVQRKMCSMHPSKRGA